MLIKNICIHKYFKYPDTKLKKVQHCVNIFFIFILLFPLVVGSPASSWNVYAQSNETDSQNQEDIRTVPQTSPEEITENTDDQLLSKNNSSNSDSGMIFSDQEIAGQSNTLQEFVDSKPDGDCLFDPSLPKCVPNENGNCPEGFNMNEDEQCFPQHDRCPSGYHSHEDDETGKCISDSVPCQPGYIMNPDFPTCEYKEYLCQKHPSLNECKVEVDNSRTTDDTAYSSGYGHGCSDAKISDSSKRYINQPGYGPSYHTPQFMSGYNDGFKICSNAGNNNNNNNNYQPPSNPIGTFKVIVEVTNQLPEDTYGGITISVGIYPDNIFKSAYGIYFPAGQSVSKDFTFKSSEVPVGTKFEVNLDYGNDYNQSIFGINTPIKKPEIVQFNIT